MTLAPCYRATCDAPGCSAIEVFACGMTSTECRSRLEELGWMVIPWRVRPEICGAPRISYMCPEHRDIRPEGWRAAREAKIRTLTKQRQIRPLNLDGVELPTVHLDAARRDAMVWMLVEAVGSVRGVARAAGVTAQRVSRQHLDYEDVIDRRQRSAEGWIEPWAKRLRAAGAIP